MFYAVAHSDMSEVAEILSHSMLIVMQNLYFTFPQLSVLYKFSETRVCLDLA